MQNTQQKKLFCTLDSTWTKQCHISSQSRSCLEPGNPLLFLDDVNWLMGDDWSHSRSCMAAAQKWFPPPKTWLWKCPKHSLWCQKQPLKQLILCHKDHWASATQNEFNLKSQWQHWIRRPEMRFAISLFVPQSWRTGLSMRRHNTNLRWCLTHCRSWLLGR